MTLAGSFLVARPVLRDPTFAQTVVLLLAHNPEGAFGLVVNRPVAADGLPFALFSGGPCPSPGLIMLHGHSEWMEPAGDAGQPTAKQEVAPGVFMGDATCLDKAGQLPAGSVNRCRVFNGYSGWGTDQLERELAAGAWAVVPASGAVLFDTPAEELWDRLLPPTLPQPSLN
jgi:putative transcriptional regulator